MVAPLSQCFNLESEINKKEYDNPFLTHEFGLNNISSSFLFYNYTSKPPAVCILKSAPSEGLSPIYKVILPQFRSAWFQNKVIFCTESMD